MAYLGLDIGSSGCKAAVISADGEMLAYASREYGYVIPQPGYAELDPSRLWQAVCAVLGELAPLAGRVKAMAVSSIGESFVPLDGEGKPLYNLITYADQRCEQIPALVEAQIPARRLYEITALAPSQMYSLHKLLWLREHRPELMRKTRRVLLANSYFTWLLTGSDLADYATASKTMLFDVRRCEWSEEILSAFSLPREWFSKPAPSGSFAGRIRRALAVELGLPEELPVFLGCHDQVGATLGGGVFSVGGTLIGEGSTESINAVADESVWMRREQLWQKRVSLEPFLEKGKYILPLGCLTFGSCLNWYVRTLESDRLAAACADGKSIYAYLEERCAAETELTFLPYLSTVMAMDAQNNALGGFVGVTLGTTRAEMYRAVIEGLNFESRRNYHVLEELGMAGGRLVVTGGFSRSPLAMQMKADVLEREIEVLENPEAGITGLAMICAVALGDVSGYTEAVDRFVHPKARFVPQRSYRRAFERYLALGDAVKAAYTGLTTGSKMDERGKI